MNVSRMSHTGPGGRLAAAITMRAPGIVKTALDRLGPADRTVAAKIVATRFVERCVASAASADWGVLSSWADATCERYAGMPSTTRVIEAALDGVARSLDITGSIRAGYAFDAARAEIEAVLGRARANAPGTQQEAVDEVDVVLDGLMTQLDQSDVLTAEHSRAVSSWCTRLGKRMGFAKDEIVQLGRAGLIHDIGKVSTPSYILCAPRRLDDEEMAIMRLHAEAGAEIIRDMPLVASFGPAVRSHHERFDGTGYPDRLKWEAIPQVARIVAVADSFNAMIGRRPYRPPLAPSVALDELVRGRGDQFDPDVVDAMIDVVANRV